jgi:hypothetical protein
LFSETKKTFDWRSQRRRQRTPCLKVFWFFFSKKNISASPIQAAQQAAPRPHPARPDAFETLTTITLLFSSPPPEKMAEADQPTLSETFV